MTGDGFRILEKERYAPDVFRVSVRAPDVTRRARAGQFVIVRTDVRGERIPLTLMDFSDELGLIEMVFQVAGTSTDKLSRLEPGECLADVVGPLGRPTEIGPFGKVACVGGGVGIAALYPIARAMVEAGKEVRVLLGSRDREHLILLDRMGALGAELEVATDDGSCGLKGFVTELVLKAAREWKPDRVIAVGPVPMMRAVALLTRDFDIPTVVSLNSIMLDGTGMCGTCRVEVGGQTRFACVDGPEFDGHLVDFDLLTERLSAYKPEEKLSWDLFRERGGEFEHFCSGKGSHRSGPHDGAG